MSLFTDDAERMHMKKKKRAIAVLSLVVIAAAAFAIYIANLQTGRCLVTTNGVYVIVDKNGSPIVMDNQSGNESLFNNLKSGDMIIIARPGRTQITSYPSKTDVIMCMRIAKGSLDDIPEAALSQLRDMGWQFASEP